MKFKKILSFAVLSSNLFLVKNIAVEAGTFFSKVLVADESGAKNKNKNESEITLDIFEDRDKRTCEAFFVIHHQGKLIDTFNTVVFNDVVGWVHGNEQVKFVKKVKKYGDIDALGGKLDLDMRENIHLIEEHMKYRVVNVVSSFIRVSLCKMLATSRNKNWNGVNPFTVSEDSYTARMVKALENLFGVLEEIQKKAGKESKWLLCAKIMFLDLRDRMRIVSLRQENAQSLVNNFE